MKPMIRERKSQRRRSAPRNAERGAALIIFTFLVALVLIPLIGLAIDGSVLYWTKAKLSAAVDAAALAIGRNPSIAPQTLATQYVTANFPAGWLGTTYSSGPTSTAPVVTNGVRSVTVNASVKVPLYFERVLGISSSIVSAAATSSRRSTNIVLILDRSGSMEMTTGPDGNHPCDTMRTAAQTFVNFFEGGVDQLELISFQTGVNVDFPFGTDFQTRSPNMNWYISQLQCGGATSSAMALNQAYTDIQNLGAPAQASKGVLNVIVFMTDGNPNGVTAYFKYPKAQTDARYYPDPYYTSGYSTGTPVSGQDPTVMDNAMPATSASCQSSVTNANGGKGLLGALMQYGLDPTPTGYTVLFQTSIPAASCSGGGSYPICNANFPNPVTASGCYMGNGYGYAAVRADLAYIPPTDAYGDNTDGPWTQANPADYIPSGPYAGKVRLDTPQAVADASYNAAYYQAYKITHDTTYKPVIFALGLGGSVDMPDVAGFQKFLRAAANDPNTNPYYDPSATTGELVYAPNNTQLQAAFEQIASQVLRLSK